MKQLEERKRYIEFPLGNNDFHYLLIRKNPNRNV